jgi:hypothetical protein
MPTMLWTSAVQGRPLGNSGEVWIFKVKNGRLTDWMMGKFTGKSYI